MDKKKKPVNPMEKEAQQELELMSALNESYQSGVKASEENKKS
ncbi:hypothetical protein [Halobacillus locisalis]|nr:hypothetical protein [Halobacillus locisalis]